MKFSVTHNLVDIHRGGIYPARVDVEAGVISNIEHVERAESYLLPGFVDSHIHIESSMVLPSEFARVAVTHGTVATVSDPHEIANVCGEAGVALMLQDAAQSEFKFCFGAPSCVPATQFETSGAHLDSGDVARMLANPAIGYLSELMDFPGVLGRDPELMNKIKAAQENQKPVDGHAPGLREADVARYFEVGISTDHECVSRQEALEKLAAGCRIQIREGSAARNFDALESLIDEYPDRCMLCSDDKHPDELLLGHINQLVVRAIEKGRDLMNVLRVACLNPVEHYGLNVGLLRVGDPADFIVVNNLNDFKVRETYLNGSMVARAGACLMPPGKPIKLNQFNCEPVAPDQLVVRATGPRIRVIEAIDGQLVTRGLVRNCPVNDGDAVADVELDILKIVVVNRYRAAKPSVGFIHGFGIQQGAFASSVAHDSHNIVAVGTNDHDLAVAINSVVDAQGGLSVAHDGVAEIMPLPVAGLMSTEECHVVAKRYTQLDRKVKEMGSGLRAPFMTLSFMSLLVIPSLKLGDQGLFDVDRFEFVPLFVAEQ